MQNVDLQAFRDWQLRGNRNVTIEMGRSGNQEHFSIWVYDYDLMEGQFVNSVDEIDLVEAKRKKLLRAQKEFEEKFGGLGEGK
jgi:hypothetical protein